MDDALSGVWEAMLSGNPGLIRRVWGDLTDDEAQAVLAHLNKMVEDETFSESQREAARKALEAIRDAG
ncbi:MAG: hypothetical protein HYZ49_01770 [Chloroflexi bacterium]|nr:hypothetical protein [Chloroflexota bacterium]